VSALYGKYYHESYALQIFFTKIIKIGFKIEKMDSRPGWIGGGTDGLKVFLEFEWSLGGFSRFYGNSVIPGAARWRRLVAAKPMLVGLFT
jgi:hypothetical protein